MTFVKVALAVVISYAVGLISFLPGGLVAYEGGMVGSLVYFGVPIDTAIAITLYERTFSNYLWLILGSFALARKRKELGIDREGLFRIRERLSRRGRS